LFGEILKFTSWTKLIYRWITKSKYISIIVATILGIISPLCTQGTIPVVITLYQGGVPVGPLMSFLAASSLMNPQLFIMTWGGLGLKFALMRLLIVFLFSVICGFLATCIPERYIIQKSIYPTGSNNEILNRPSKKFTFRILLKNCFDSMLFVGRFMALGVLIGTLIEAFIPQDLVMYALGKDTVSTILVAAIAGIPLYACGGGIIPTVRSMMIQGMGEGAAMAFMTVGQATRISPLIALGALIRPLFIVGYCVLLVVFSVITGLII
jgi:uncharacterized membrane protein YraQ (UPF0718 family)